MVALQTEGYGFTIIELVEPADIELGDEMRWEPGTGLGGHVYANLTKGKSVRVLRKSLGAERAATSATAAASKLIFHEWILTKSEGEFDEQEDASAGILSDHALWSSGCQHCPSGQEVMILQPTQHLHR